MEHNSKKIFVVSELYFPEETATGNILTGIAEGLAREFEVNVICGRPSDLPASTRVNNREIRNGVSIHRCFETTLSKDVFLFRLLNIASLSIAVFFKSLLNLQRGDNVLVVTNPPTLPFIVALSCKLKRARCLLLIHDVYPEVMVAAGFSSERGGITLWFRWINRLLYRTVDGIIVLGRDMRELVEQKLHDRTKKIDIIPNWANLSEIHPEKREENKFLAELGIATKFVVQYSGNMGRTHGLETIAECARQLNGNDSIHFLLIGNGAKKAWLEETVLELGLKNVTILPPRSRNDLSNSLGACDVSVISFVSGMAGVSVPSRMYNVLASGRPIIAVADHKSELAQVVTEEQVGWVVTPDSAEKLAEVILEARANPTVLAEMGGRARRVAVEKYSVNQVIDAYLTLFHSLDRE